MTGHVCSGPDRRRLPFLHRPSPISCRCTPIIPSYQLLHACYLASRSREYLLCDFDAWTQQSLVIWWTSGVLSVHKATSISRLQPQGSTLGLLWDSIQTSDDLPSVVYTFEASPTHTACRFRNPGQYTTRCLVEPPPPPAHPWTVTTAPYWAAPRSSAPCL